MSVFLTEDKKEIIVTCNDKCEQSFHICVDEEDDMDMYAWMVFLKADFDTLQDMTPWRAFCLKWKKIWMILRGKDYCYSDVMMTKEDFMKVIEYVNQFKPADISSNALNMMDKSMDNFKKGAVSPSMDLTDFD
jgi:hypothetical protein